MRRLALASGVVVAILGVAAVPASAKPTNSGTTSASIALNPGDPSIGQSVSFITTYPKTVKNPVVEVNCYQNGTLVWGQVGSVTGSYKLGGDSSPWLNNGGGPANCEADLLSQVWNGNSQEQMTLMAYTTFAATA